MTSDRAAPGARQLRNGRGTLRARRETIQAAAVRLKDGRIFTGPSHYIIVEHLIDAKQAKLIESAHDGFITTAGRFVSRADGHVIARRSGQVFGDSGDRSSKYDASGPVGDLHAAEVEDIPYAGVRRFPLGAASTPGVLR
ncbi:MAG: hypothetical protein ACR2G6_07635 [Gemmatimonadaceae bacterium]